MKSIDLTKRFQTIQFNIGDKLIGGNSPILIQTMSDIKTSKIDENIKLVDEVYKLGCDLIRFSCLDLEDCKALSEIKKHSKIPIIADIHFQLTFALEAIKSGVDKIRINPGNLNKNQLDELINKVIEKDVSLRIGVNSGSLGKYIFSDQDKVKQFKNALDDILNPFEKKGFSKIVLASKDSNPLTTLKLYQMLAENYKYPLHVGVTEAGFGVNGAIKSCVGLIPILNLEIGNTIRMSLADSPQTEVIACKNLLNDLNLRSNVARLICCPSCGRTQVQLQKIAQIVEDKLIHTNKNITVAVMGCPVNGPGEAKEAEFGIAGGINSFTLFNKGEVIGTFSEKEALVQLFKLIDEA